MSPRSLWGVRDCAVVSTRPKHRFKTIRVHRPPIPVLAGRGEDGSKTGTECAEHRTRSPAGLLFTRDFERSRTYKVIVLLTAVQPVMMFACFLFGRFGLMSPATNHVCREQRNDIMLTLAVCAVSMRTMMHPSLPVHHWNRERFGQLISSRPSPAFVHSRTTTLVRNSLMPYGALSTASQTS